jgi:hypothetical protein
MAYDAATSQLVLVTFEESTTDDTVIGIWIWTGSTWTEESPAASPPSLFEPSLAYDAAASQLVLFGGNDEAYELPHARPLAQAVPRRVPEAPYIGMLAP